MPTDEELAAAYIAGDESAFEALVKRHLPSVYTFAVRFVGSERDAEDIAQETFLKAWKHLRRYHPGTARFKTWLMRIARNTAVDYLRKRKEEPFSKFADADGESVFDEVEDEVPGPEELFSLARERETLERAIAALAPAHREVILLYIGNDLTFEEIGQALGESVNTVKSRYRRAVAALRTALHRSEG